jgi:hypothetical protein
VIRALPDPVEADHSEPSSVVKEHIDDGELARMATREDGDRRPAFGATRRTVDLKPAR